MPRQKKELTVKATIRTRTKKAGAEVLESYDPFNGKITLDGLTVTLHRKGVQVVAKTVDEAKQLFLDAIADTQF